MVLFCSILLSDTNAQNTLGVRAAYNKTTAVKHAGYADYKPIDRLQVGVFGKFDLYKRFFVRANVMYNQKGSDYSDIHYFADAGRVTRIKLNYLEVAADLGYSIKLIGRHKILVSAGPYLAYGLNGTEKGYGESLMGSIVYNRKVDFTHTDYYDGKSLTVEPVDAGLNINVGYQYRKYGLFFNYGLGLSNTHNEGTDLNKSYNRVASVGVSYSIR